MRAAVGFIGVIVVFAGMAVGQQLLAPYASIGTVALLGALAGLVAGVAAVLWAGDRTKRLKIRVILLGTTAFWCAGIGALSSAGYYRVRHQDLGVYNPHTRALKIAVDGHVVGEVPAGYPAELSIPKGVAEVTALDGESVVDRASLDVAGPGTLVFDIGATRCFAEQTVRYSTQPISFGPGPSQHPLFLGEDHVFRTGADILWTTPTTLKSTEKSETRTVLIHQDCTKRKR